MATSESLIKKYVRFVFVLIPFFTSMHLQAQVITKLAGGKGTSGGDGGPATAAGLNRPNSVAADDNGNVFIVDYDNYVVRKVDPSGIISRFAGNGMPGSGGDGVPATSEAIGTPNGIAVDKSGNVYISDYKRVRKIDKFNIITTVAGNPFATSAGDGGPATDAGLGVCMGLHVDKYDNLYIVDQDNHNVRKVNSSGIISTVAGNGSAGYSGDGGPATNAQISYPWCVAVDGSGNVYITDYASDVVRKVNTSGIISTFAGSGLLVHSGDGVPATAAGIDQPYGIAIDGHDNVYISENGKPYIRIVGSTGIINTYAGTGVTGDSGDGGAATAATLYDPSGICIDQCNNLYVANGVGTVRKISGILGSEVLCLGSPITLVDNAPGGSWSSSAPGIATINPTTGYVTPITSGTTMISYTIGGNSAVTTMSVTPAPNSGVISGPSFTCQGTTITLTDNVAGGFWHNTTSNVFVSASGDVIRGDYIGMDTVVYEYANACGVAKTKYPVNVLDGRQCDSALDVKLQSPLTAVGITAFPNPGKGSFSITVTSTESARIPVIITNMMGRKMAEFTVEPNRPVEEHLNLEPGIYLLTTEDSRQKYMSKLIVE